MKWKSVLLLCLVSAVSGWVGYYLGAMRNPGAMRLAGDSGVALDYLVSTKSFSEVEQARAVLDALAGQYAQSAERLIVQEHLSQQFDYRVRMSNPERPTVAAIHLLDEALPEFRGTEAELRLLKPLLIALKREKLYDRWLDAYLDALYRHPTHEMMSTLAAEALGIGQTVGREQELTAGLRYVSDFPFHFPAKSKIEHTLMSALARTRFAGHDHECPL